jgi:hypothetical protein
MFIFIGTPERAARMQRLPHFARVEKKVIMCVSPEGIAAPYAPRRAVFL